MQVTAAMPLRAWLHCGSCNHLWKMPGPRLLCRWIGGGTFQKTADAAREAPIDLPADVPPTRTTDPAVERWLCEESENTRHPAEITVSQWLESDPMGQPAVACDAIASSRGTQAEVLNEQYFLPPTSRPSASAPTTLGERLDTFYDGLTRLEEFVKRCVREEQALADAAQQALAASAEATAAAANTPSVHRGAVLPFKRPA